MIYLFVALETLCIVGAVFAVLVALGKRVLPKLAAELVAKLFSGQ